MISVVIPALNAECWLGRQLEALANQSYAGDWELIVADNGSTDGTRSLARTWAGSFPRFQLVDASGVSGVAHARNCGARESASDALLICDADDVVCREWIALMTDRLSDSPIVTGPVEHFVDGRTPSWEEVQQTHHRLRVGPFDYLLGCNMGIRRELLFELGAFDETMTRGWEDIDFGIRAQLRGISIAFVDRAIVLRRRPTSTRAMWHKEFNYGRGWTMLERRYPQISPNGWVRPFLRRAGWAAVRAPYVAVPSRRRGWMVRAAGLAGCVAERLRPSA